MPRGVPASGQRARRRTKAEMAAAREALDVTKFVKEPPKVIIEEQKPVINGFIIQTNASELIKNRYQISKGIGGYSIYDHKAIGLDKQPGDLIRDKSKEIIRFTTYEKAMNYVS